MDERKGCCEEREQHEVIAEMMSAKGGRREWDEAVQANNVKMDEEQPEPNPRANFWIVFYLCECNEFSTLLQNQRRNRDHNHSIRYKTHKLRKVHPSIKSTNL